MRMNKRRWWRKKHTGQKEKRMSKEREIERNKCYEFVSVFDWKMLLDSMPMVVFRLRSISVMHFHTSTQTISLVLMLLFLRATSFFTLHNIVTEFWGQLKRKLKAKGNAQQNDFFFSRWVKLWFLLYGAHRIECGAKVFPSLVDCFSIILILK